MTIELRPELEAEIRRLAYEGGRDIQAVVTEAIRQYLEAVAITDVTAEEVGCTQDAMISELETIEDWSDETRNTQ